MVLSQNISVALSVIALVGLVGAGVAVHEECVAVRPSATLKYASVTIGPVWVTSADQVLAIYAAMRADERLRFFL